MIVSDSEKRWLVIGIAINKVVAPVLRDVIKQGMDTHYTNLDTYCSGLTTPCTLATLTYHQVHADPNLRRLKFQNINNNLIIHRNPTSWYNYNVNSSVDLAKLYLHDKHLAEFSAFDESLDMTAILQLLQFNNYHPAAIFSVAIQTSADAVRKDVRNKWGHFDVTEWTEAFYNDCFSKLETLVRSLGLTSGKEKNTLDQLSDWRGKGCQLCMGHAVDKDLLSLIQTEVNGIIKDLALQSAQLFQVQQTAAFLQARLDDGEATRKKEMKPILERLTAIEKNLGDELLRRVQGMEEIVEQAEQRATKTDQKLDQLEQRATKMDQKVNQMGLDLSDRLEQLELRVESEKPVKMEVRVDVEFKEYRPELNQSLDAVAGHDQVPRDHHSNEPIMAYIAKKYLKTSPPQNEKEFTDFLTYLREVRKVIYGGHEKGSLVITVWCVSLKILEELWVDYKTGHLGEVVQKCFVTRELLEDLNLTELRLQTTVKEEEYKKAKAYFEKGRAERKVVSSISGEIDKVQDKAIPLCLPANIKWNAETGEIQKLEGARGDFYVVEEAFAELRKIKEPICVVAITGEYKSGKSFILSETFDQDEVFPMGFTMDIKTVGLWIWILPGEMQDINGCTYRVVLLDSEGIDACSAEGRNDNQTLVLTILLASLLIYNSLSVPRGRDLQHLGFVAKISHQIKVSSTGGSLKNEDAFHKTFPYFIWLFRNVTQQVPEEFEGIKDYLLKRVFKPNISKIDEPQDAIAEGVLKYFSGFDAFFLPVPTYDHEALRDLKKKKNLLNPDFLTGTKQFGALLKSKMGPKRSFNGGEFVTGEGMAFLTKLYVDAINDPFSIPNVQIAWETFVRTKCENAKEKAVLAYKRKMETDLSKLPRGASEILASHESAFSESMEIFEKETAGISYESTRMDREELTKEQAEQLSFWKAENDKLTQESCSTLLKELRQKHLDPVLSQLHGPFGTSISFEDIDNACAQIEQDYKDFAFGAKDVCADVFHEFHQSLEAEMGLYEMMIKNLKCYEETLLKQRRENAQKEKETEEERELAKYLEKQLELEGKKFKMFEKEKEKELFRKIQEFQWQEENLKRKIRDIEAAGMEKQIEMESKLREANNEKEILQRQVKNLK